MKTTCTVCGKDFVKGAKGTYSIGMKDMCCFNCYIVEARRTPEDKGRLSKRFKEVEDTATPIVAEVVEVEPTVVKAKKTKTKSED